MTLLIKNITLRNFRSYKNVSLCLDPVLTIFFGPNAAGKTNIIEALQLTTEGISFRNPRWEEIINQPGLGEGALPALPSAGASVSMRAEGDGLFRDVKLKIYNGRRFYEINDKKIRGSKEVAGTILCIVFTPEDLSLIKSSSENRRNEIDNLGSQLSKKYTRLLAEYKKILQHRNKLLKEDRVYDTLFEAVTDQATTLGAVLQEQRLELLARLIPLFTAAYSQINIEEQFSVGYRNTLVNSEVWSLKEIEAFRDDTIKDTKEKFNLLLAKRKTEEISRKSTIVGPHRDDLVFFIDGKDARTFGSQGQQRSVVLAWKIAEIHLIEEMTGKRPLLLLDDVMSELDESRRQALTDLIGTMGQTVITTAHIGYFEKDIINRAKVIDVRTLEQENNNSRCERSQKEDDLKGDDNE